MLILSPMTMAPVCRVGDPLQLTCTASAPFIRWNIVVVNEHGVEEEITAIRNSIDLSPEPKERIINSTTFTFSRTSAEDVSPLITTLSIDSVSIGLNGTIVNCRDANNPMVSASTTIQIMEASSSKLNLLFTIIKINASNPNDNGNRSEHFDIAHCFRRLWSC